MHRRTELMQNTTCENVKWLSEEESCKLLNIKVKTLKDKCRNGEFNYKIERIGTKNFYYVNVNSIPNNKRLKFTAQDVESDSSYSDSPSWATVQADKYTSIMRASDGMRGQQLRDYIEDWNVTNPHYRTSYSQLMDMKVRFRNEGVKGIMARYGHHKSRNPIDDDHYEYFKNLYLKEGAPSLRSCWDLTVGYAMKKDNVEKSKFPCPISFKRRLERELTKDSIYLARYGESAWNRKFGKYIDRDYTDVICGKVWVSDHAQIDVACIDEDGNVVFPWVTAWRDYKSSKWLGWILQTGHPNSDHIFQAFYYAAENYGLPEDVIIDNGKDYRSKDFAGGRKVVKVDANQARTTSMLMELNVKPNFALPYNAQTKPIERDFLKIKELLSKHCIGYRGGNVVERPEILAKEIKQGKIMPFDKFKELFDDFIINVLNKRPSQGINLNGLSPDALFNEEFKEKVTVSRDALKLFCMRTSKNFTIGRNGIKDNQLKITYWADWMYSQTGLKVYLRRDPSNFKEAWAFKADNNEYVGNVTAVKAIAALHADEISREEFKEAMASKKRKLKIAKAYIKQTREITLEEQIENYKTAYATVEKQANPKTIKIANTNMDMAVRKHKQMEAFGKQDLSQFMTESVVKDEPLYLFETDKILDQESRIQYKEAVNEH